MILNKISRGADGGVWRDGSEVRSTDCSCRGPKFNSQQPHDGSQLSVTGSDALFCCIRRQLQCTHIHKNKCIFKKRRKAEGTAP